MWRWLLGTCTILHATDFTGLTQVVAAAPAAVPGVLVLSEFAGAAQSLGAGAILVNPWNITDMAAAIEDALTMSEQARQCFRRRFNLSEDPFQHLLRGAQSARVLT